MIDWKAVAAAPLQLEWKMGGTDYWETVVGDFEGGDGVRLTIQLMPTCYRRGRWRLLVEVCGGPNHHKWGCFDEEDQPMRWYHLEDNARSEALLIAHVLIADRARKDNDDVDAGR